MEGEGASRFRVFKATRGYRETCTLAKWEERKHLSLRLMAAGHHSLVQQNPQNLLQDLFFHCRWSFAHVFFPLVRGPWLTVLQPCSYNIYKAAVCLHWVSPQALHTEERTLGVQEMKNTRGGGVLHEICTPSLTAGQVRVAQKGVNSAC